MTQPGVGGVRPDHGSNQILAELEPIRKVLERVEKHLEASKDVNQSISMG